MHEVKPSALLALRPCAVSDLLLCIKHQQGKVLTMYFNYFPEKYLDKSLTCLMALQLK